VIALLPGGRTVDRATAIVISASLVIVANWVPTPAKAILTLPVLLTAPGWYLLPSTAHEPSAVALSRLGLAVVLSVAITTLVAVMLGATSIHITAGSVSLALAALIALGGALRPVPPPWTRLKQVTADRRVALWALSLLAACGAIVFASIRLDAGKPTPKPFSALSLTGYLANATGPIPVAVGERLSVGIELQNIAAEGRSYRVLTAVGGWRSETDVHLGAGGAWSGPLTVTVPALSTARGGACLERLTITAVPVSPAAAKSDSVGVWLTSQDCEGHRP
jgi:hypothetical protein